MFNCELKKIPINVMHKDCMGLLQLELACCWYDPCQQGWVWVGFEIIPPGLQKVGMFEEI